MNDEKINISENNIAFKDGNNTASGNNLEFLVQKAEKEEETQKEDIMLFKEDLILKSDILASNELLKEVKGKRRKSILNLLMERSKLSFK